MEYNKQRNTARVLSKQEDNRLFYAGMALVCVVLLVVLVVSFQ